MLEEGKLECICEDKSIRIKEASSCSTYKTLNEKLKQKSTESKRKHSKLRENEVLCETKPNISTKLLVITDKYIKIPYMFDINAQHSIISKGLISSYEKDELVPEIWNVWGNNMKALGYTTLNVNIGLQQSLPHKFYVIESNNPFAILGSDFMVKRNLTINTKEKTITQAEIGVKLKLELSDPSCKKSIRKEVKNLLETFSVIAKESSKREKPQHNHVLDIKLKNEVLPRHKKAITPNTIISKTKENIFNKLSKGSIPKTIYKDKNNLPISSFLPTVKSCANKTIKLTKAVILFSKKWKVIQKVISLHSNRSLSCLIETKKITRDNFYLQQKNDLKDYTHLVT